MARAIRHFFKHAKCPAGWRASVFALEVEPAVDCRGREDRRGTYGRAIRKAEDVGTCRGCGGTVLRNGETWRKGGIRLECMGRVVGDRLHLHGLGTPCDGRCTGAVGPSCDCSCGGENHGTRRLIEVTTDNGAAPKLALGRI